MSGFINLNEKIPTPLKAYLVEMLACWIDGLDESPAVSLCKKTLFKKYVPETERSPLLSEIAKKTFLETEDVCKATNERVRRFISSPEKDWIDPRVFYLASQKINRILGSFRINEMLDLGRFGPGSTFRCRGRDISKARKFTLTDVTPEFHCLARGLLAEYPMWAGYLADADLPVCPMLEIVPGGRYLTVAKDSSTDRSIIVEPTINSWFQQGLGRMIRKRLKRHAGIDLDDQSRNREMAYYGSLTGQYATVDLSSASDLISREIVETLIPKDWLFWLNATRSHRVLVDGIWIELEKFSSMGNGFTFDLQSLIFYALTQACVEIEGYAIFGDEVSVFGDDIVLPAGVKDLFLEVFGSCGFSVNYNKSFFDGPFRESCGHDYYSGVNIRGVYLKRLNILQDIVAIHNRLFEWAKRTSLSVEEPMTAIRSVMKDFPCRTPINAGDIGLAHHFDEVCPSLASTDPRFVGWEGFVAKACVPRFRKEESYSRFMLPSRLQGSEWNGNFLEIRDNEGPVGYRIRDIVVPSWD